jgi:hypothetical protein
MTERRHFFIVGAQRSGTTYLYHVLNEHPEIEMAMPVRPEPKFFLNDDLAGRGAAYYDTTFFPGKAGAWQRGEKGTSYIESEKAARQIARTFPDAMILLALRNPIERAISNYWFSVNNGIETEPLDQAFLREGSRREQYDRTQFSVSPFAYLKRGCYIDYITLYERYFPRAQMIILIFEEFTTRLAAIQRLYARLGVAPDFVPPSAGNRINVSEKQDEQILTPDMRQYLVNYFAGPNARLAEHLVVDLEQWGW